MYKVNIPLPGYAYTVGTVTPHIHPSDVPVFLKKEMITEVKVEEKTKAPAKKSTGKK